MESRILYWTYKDKLGCYRASQRNRKINRKNESYLKKKTVGKE